MGVTMTEIYPRRWWALGALAVSLLTVGLDLTVLNVAVPTLAVDLGATTTQLQWFGNAYTLALAALLLPAGLLGDRFGPKKLLLGALAVFGLASLGCAYADSPGQLIAARVVLGVGAAFLIPLSLSLLNILFPPEERAKALTTWVMATFVGIPLGPLLGGWLLDHFAWGSVFLINVPLTVVGLVAVLFLVPLTRGSGQGAIDFRGIALSAAGLVALTYGFVYAGEHGWAAPATYGLLALGAALLGVFCWTQTRVASPLADLVLFREPRFVWGAVLATVASFALMGVMFVLPQLFQAVQGADALQTGVRLLPLIAGMLVASKVAERLVAAFGVRVVVTAGFVLLAAGLAWGSATTPSDGYGATVGWELRHRPRHRVHADPADVDGDGRAHRGPLGRRFGADPGAAPGRRHHRRRGAGHRPQRRLPRRRRHRRPAGPGGGRGARQRFRRDRRRREAAPARARRLRAARVHRRHGRDAVGVRRARRGRRGAGAAVPARAAGRGGAPARIGA